LMQKCKSDGFLFCEVMAGNARSAALPLIMRKATRSAFRIVPFAKAKSRRTTRCTAALLTI